MIGLRAVAPAKAAKRGGVHVRRTIQIPDETIEFERTPQDKGVQCTLRVTRYDRVSGAQWAINGKPIGTGLDVA